MKILITGDRNWTDKSVIERVLRRYKRSARVIHGNARGADKLSAEVARELGFTDIQSYPADWEKYKRAAGPIRNREMFDTEQPDVVHAFHDSLQTSKGTRDMINYTKANDTEYFVHTTSVFIIEHYIPTSPWALF